MRQSEKISAVTLASYILAGIALLLILKAGLLVALFSGLLVYSLIHRVANLIEKRFRSEHTRMLVVMLLSAILLFSLATAIWLLLAYFRSDAGNIHVLMQKLADILDTSREQSPEWLRNNLPEGVDALQEWVTRWLREHAAEAQLFGKEAGHILVHLLLGLVIGSMIAVSEKTPPVPYKPLAAALLLRLQKLSDIFEKIVFAQIRISLINTALTAFYLLIILPLAGVHLPLSKSLIVIAFLAGLIPVAGNIFSNTIIVIISLAHSIHAAGGSLLFLMLIHKLEYFLNARIIGAQVNAKAWELLTAILVMETLFGLPGVVAAPVFYPYVKKELQDRGLI
jgi:predicted PurR-regulated permease PerM